MSVANLSASEYAKVENWDDFINSGKDLTNIYFDLSWYVMFSKLLKDPKFTKTNQKLIELIRNNKGIKVYPFPSYVFKAFQITKANELKVVFLGQDPYFNCEYYEKKCVPQAMGLSFSVPDGVAIPSSLDNIFKNMVKFNHIDEKPKSGNLWFWAAQGCLMLNAALTVEDGKKEAHLKLWEWFSEYVINYISTNMDGIVFVLWGAYALKKLNIIDESRHTTIVSSHPSGLSKDKSLGKYPSFMSEDTFGKVNKALVKYGKTKILWD
jgi:uracil-DNA glycosylase